MATGSHCMGEIHILCLWLSFVKSRKSIRNWDNWSFGCLVKISAVLQWQSVCVLGQCCPRRVPAAGTAMAGWWSPCPDEHTGQASTMQWTALCLNSPLMFVPLASIIFLWKERKRLFYTASDWANAFSWPQPAPSLEPLPCLHPCHTGQAHVLGVHGPEEPQAAATAFLKEGMGRENSPVNTWGLLCLREAGAGFEVARVLRCCHVCVRDERDGGVVQMRKGEPETGTGPFALDLNK